MPDSDPLWDVRCPACDWAEVCGPEEIRKHLTREGILRRNGNPSSEELRELMKAVHPRIRCPQCQHKGLSLRPVAEPAQDTAWGGPVKCKSCRQPIPAARVQALPGVTLCLACQTSQDR